MMDRISLLISLNQTEKYVHYRFTLSAQWILKVQVLGKTLKTFNSTLDTLT